MKYRRRWGKAHPLCKIYDFRLFITFKRVWQLHNTYRYQLLWPFLTIPLQPCQLILLRYLTINGLLTDFILKRFQERLATMLCVKTLWTPDNMLWQMSSVQIGSLSLSGNPYLITLDRSDIMFSIGSHHISYLIGLPNTFVFSSHLLSPSSFIDRTCIKNKTKN